MAENVQRKVCILESLRRPGFYFTGGYTVDRQGNETPCIASEITVAERHEVTPDNVKYYLQRAERLGAQLIDITKYHRLIPYFPQTGYQFATFGEKIAHFQAVNMGPTIFAFEAEEQAFGKQRYTVRGEGNPGAPKQLILF